MSEDQEKYGIEATKKVTGTFIELGTIVGEIVTGKITPFQSVMKLLSEAKDLPSLLERFKELPDEFIDLSDSELEDLFAHVHSNFDIMDDDLEKDIEDTFDLLLDFAHLSKKGVSLGIRWAARAKKQKAA